MYKRALLLIVGASSLLATTLRIPTGESIATIVFPNSWKTDARGEITEGMSPDGKLHFAIVRVEQHKVAEVMGEVMAYIRGRSGASIRSDSMQSRTGRVNGRDARFLSWKGETGLHPVEIQYVIFSSGGDAAWLAAYWGDPALLQRRRDELENIVNSVKTNSSEKAEGH